uniref:Syntaxin N-terminal domain-containing protein n=1 Tax=Aegilops tauschii subsp. strangulata TaxID=200361 RepID=A0A453NQQ9_AEGTS
APLNSAWCSEMNDLFSSSSFKKYADLKDQVALDEMEAGGGANLDMFFEDVEGVKEDIRSLEAMHRRLQSVNEESKTAHDARAVKSLRARMDGDVEQVLRRAKVVKAKLEALDRANAASRKLPGCGAGSSTDRTRSSVVSGLGNKLKDLMDDFQVNTYCVYLASFPRRALVSYLTGESAGPSDADGGGVQGDGGAAVLHGDGGDGGGEHDRCAHLVGGERDVPAEGDPAGPRARAGDGHGVGDPGAARRREGHRAQPAGAAPGVPGHGGAGGGAGPPAQQHRDPRRARQLLRDQGHRGARLRARLP